MTKNKVIGFMVIGRGEGDRWLKSVLGQWQNGLVDDAILCLNDVDEKTKKIAKASGFWCAEDNREWGKFQPSIKTDLLAKVAKLKPDIVLPKDADEFYDSTFNREELEKLADQGHLGYYFYIVNLWNDELHYRKHLSFWNIRMFKFAPEYGLTFIRKNVHPGLAPPYAYYYGTEAPFLIQHKGLMKPEDRQLKFERYQKYDPQGRHKPTDWYNELLRNTPGTTFVESDILNKIKSEWKLTKPKHAT